MEWLSPGKLHTQVVWEEYLTGEPQENILTQSVTKLFDRVLIELVSKMQEMNMDKTELGCLRAIVLFNPDVKGLTDINRVELLRERVYATLEEYTRSVAA